MFKKIVLALTAAMAITGITSAASAEGLSLHVSGGPAQVLWAPLDHPGYAFSRNQFKTGDAASGSILFNLTPNLVIGPAASASYFEVSANDNAQASVLWDFSGLIRLQGSHAASVSPFISAAGGVDKHASTWNPALQAAIGLDFALEPTHTFWAGVYGGYDHVFQTQGTSGGPIMNGHDVNIASVGLQLTFDAPVKPVVHTVVQTQTVQIATPAPMARVVVERVVVPLPVGPEMFVAKQVVQFAKDSSTLDAAATAFLDHFATLANNDAAATAEVRGHASNDGDAAYNLTLSRARAQAVVDYLVSKGVAASRLSVAALGETGDGDPNRVVDFVITLNATK